LDFIEYGTLIFCEECVMSMAQLLGFITPGQARELEARVEEAERELIQSRSMLQNLGSLRVSLDALGIGARNDDASISSFSDPVDEQDEGSTGGDSQESDDLSEGKQPDSSESVDESRSDDSSNSVPTYDPFASLRSL
jgi:hypothetical protein